MGETARVPKAIQRQAVLDYLNSRESFGCTSSWDLAADEYFARAVGLIGLADELAGFISRINGGPGGPPVVPRLVDWHRANIHKPITKRRLAILRELEAAGVVESSWTGLKDQASVFGFNRVREYWLHD